MSRPWFENFKKFFRFLWNFYLKIIYIILGLCPWRWWGIGEFVHGVGALFAGHCRPVGTQVGDGAETASTTTTAGMFWLDLHNIVPLNYAMPKL